jgi:hypothetical protein
MVMLEGVHRARVLSYTLGKLLLGMVASWGTYSWKQWPRGNLLLRTYSWKWWPHGSLLIGTSVWGSGSYDRSTIRVAGVIVKLSCHAPFRPGKAVGYEDEHVSLE